MAETASMQKVDSTTGPPVNVLLLGCSQNGKSTLANLLYQGRKWHGFGTAFPIGTGLSSCTQEMQIMSKEYCYKHEFLLKHEEGPCYPIAIIERLRVQIIDTPGIGDTQGQDAQHMHQVLTRLNQLQCDTSAASSDAGAPIHVAVPVRVASATSSDAGAASSDAGAAFHVAVPSRVAGISLVLFVSKFGSKLDEAQQREIKFYGDMLGPALQANTAIVITNAPGTERWRRIRGEDPFNVMRQQKQQILDCLPDVNDLPMIYLDADPIDDDEIDIARKAHALIMDMACSNEPISLNTLRISKLPKWVDEDQTAIAALEGAKNGLKSGLDLHTQQRQDQLRHVTSLTERTAKLAAELEEPRRQLEAKDTDDELINIATLAFSDTWHFLWRPSETFDIKTEYRIAKRTVSQGWLELEIDEDQHIKGKIKASMFTVLSATVKLFATKRERYAKEIAQLAQTVATKQAELEEAESRKKDWSKSADGSAEGIAELEAKLQDIEQQIVHLRKPTLSIEELVARMEAESAHPPL